MSSDQFLIDNTEGAAQLIASLARQSSAPKAHPHADGQPFVVLDEGQTVETLSLPQRPHRHRGTVMLDTIESFVAYVNLAAADTPDLKKHIYCRADPVKFVAVLNDHDAAAGWRDWRAVFTPRASQEWSAWAAANKKKMTQLEFAEFLEDRTPDFVSPSGGDILEAVLNFEASKASAFKSAQRLADGSVNFAYVDEATGAGAFRLPTVFALGLPVFDRGDSYPIEARMKWRLADGKLVLWYELVRPHKVLETAFEALRGGIMVGTGRKLLDGAPE